jgi:RNA polymerase sigma-70 factor (ECF subfamily)
MLSALDHFDRFEGSQEAEFLAWLEQIHKNNAFEAARHHVKAAKRAVTREQSRGGEQTTGAYFPPAKAATPSNRVIRREEEEELVAALDHLLADQREAVRLKYLEGCTLAEIAARMQRSEEAAAGLLKRGLKTLRKHLGREDES